MADDPQIAPKVLLKLRLSRRKPETHAVSMLLSTVWVQSFGQSLEGGEAAASLWPRRGRRSQSKTRIQTWAELDGQ